MDLPWNRRRRTERSRRTASCGRVLSSSQRCGMIGALRRRLVRGSVRAADGAKERKASVPRAAAAVPLLRCARVPHAAAVGSCPRCCRSLVQDVRAAAATTKDSRACRRGRGGGGRCDVEEDVERRRGSGAGRGGADERDGRTSGKRLAFGGSTRRGSARRRPKRRSGWRHLHSRKGALRVHLDPPREPRSAALPMPRPSPLRECKRERDRAAARATPPCRARRNNRRLALTQRTATRHGLRSLRRRTPGKTKRPLAGRRLALHERYTGAAPYFFPGV